MKNYLIPFNKPYKTGNELSYINEALSNSQLSGDGAFSKKCQRLIADHLCGGFGLLTPSCTAALEMTAILLDLKEGDEVIMPSYTFVSTANAFVLRGATPVFVDIREDTLNIDERKIENAISDKTKAIVVVHYAGVGCEMDAILALSVKYQIPIIEDNAQGLGAYYKGKALGSFGAFSTYSFHETKNIHCGEGGALVVNAHRFEGEAEVVRDKGTDRAQFFKGEVDKYTWQSVGSSFLPSELSAAFLYAQLQQVENITAMRLDLWKTYFDGLKELENKGYLRLPQIPPDCIHNGHIFFVILENSVRRDEMIQFLKLKGVNAVFHYIPLHSSPGGKRFGKYSGQLFNTEKLSSCIMRLPVWIGMSKEMQYYVIEQITEFCKG